MSRDGSVTDGQAVAIPPGISVSSCGVHGQACTAQPPAGRHALVFQRSGALLRRLDGRAAVVDASMAYLHRPGAGSWEHLGSLRHRTTVVVLTDEWAAGWLRTVPDLGPGGFVTSPELDLQQRRLLARAVHGQGACRAELERLVAAAAAEAAAGRPRRPPVVSRALEALATSPRRLDLLALAAVVGVSPHHLSRVFREATGLTLREHRNRLRVRRALNRLADGEPSLSAIAYDVGFADHAHFTRTVRAQLCLAPRDVRAMLAGPEGGAGDRAAA